MNILYISSEYPPETGFGGIGTYTMHAAEAMAGRGHTVHVICRSPDCHATIKVINRVTVHRIPSDPYPLPRQRCFYPLRKLCHKAIPHSLHRLAWAATVNRYSRTLSRDATTFDIVEYPECGAEGFYISKAFPVTIARLHTPWSMIRTLDSIREPLSDSIMHSYLEKRSVKKSTVVTSPSQALANRYRKRWRLRALDVIANPIPTANYSLRNGHDWLYLGRIERRKGVHLLVEAYAQLCTTSTPPKLRLVGKPYGTEPNGMTYGEYIKKLICTLNLTNSIEVIEGVPHAETLKYIHDSSAAFFPSLWENFPYACLETMASGVTVAASATGGYPEIITDSVNGILFTPGNACAITTVMQRLLDSPDMAAKLGKNARNHIHQQYDSSIIGEKMEQLYSRVISSSSTFRQSLS